MSEHPEIAEHEWFETPYGDIPCRTETLWNVD